MSIRNKYSDRVDKALSEIIIPEEPEGLYDPIRYTMESKGKRLRPAMTLMGCDLFNGPINKALPAAIGMEIFHNFTLLHDDIMDKSPMRRGKPSVYKKWDVNTAILAGDTMFVYANEQVCKTESKYLKNVLAEFNKLAREVCEGQKYDMEFEVSDNISIADYIRMIRLKTAVLIGGSLKIGAIIAGTSQENQEKLYQFGINIGVAFQLQDDYLDIFGNEKSVGKQIGNDIITNKKTYLYLKALEIAKENTQHSLKETYNSNDGSPKEKIEIVKKIFNHLNIDHIAKDEMEKYFHLANKYLESIDVKDENKNELRDFVFNLKERNN
ncbi:MAG: polyprenyl synthetase family protein [Bacteroidales bacterium]